MRLRDPVFHQLEQLYRARHAHFLRVARAIVGDPERAHEAVQDGFADALRSRRTFRGDGPLEAWVWRAVVNAARKQQRRSDVVSADLSAPPENDRFEQSEISRLISELPERQRLALFLRYYVDLDYRSIARVLEIEVGTVSATLSAAHSTLRRALQEVPG